VRVVVFFVMIPPGEDSVSVRERGRERESKAWRDDQRQWVGGGGGVRGGMTIDRDGQDDATAEEWGRPVRYTKPPKRQGRVGAGTSRFKGTGGAWDQKEATDPIRGRRAAGQVGARKRRRTVVGSLVVGVVVNFWGLSGPGKGGQRVSMVKKRVDRVASREAKANE
jgi:hypothetical protein